MNETAGRRERPTRNKAPTGTTRFEGDPLGWDRLEHLDAVARRFLVKWGRAVALQAERVLDRRRNFGDREVDAWQFCTAARQLTWAVDMISELPETTPQLHDVVDLFRQDHPNLKVARDVIDHFDDYATGVGDLAHPNMRRGRRTASQDAAQRFEPRFVVDEESSYIEIDGSRIDVLSVADAVATLVANVLTEFGFPLHAGDNDLPSTDPTDPRVYVMLLSYISRHDVTPQHYSDFVESCVEDPSTWPPVGQIQADLGRHLPMNASRDLGDGLLAHWLFPDTYAGRQVAGPDRAILDGWAVIVVPQADHSWRIRTYTRNPGS